MTKLYSNTQLLEFNPKGLFTGVEPAEQATTLAIYHAARTFATSETEALFFQFLDDVFLLTTDDCGDKFTKCPSLAVSSLKRQPE